MVVKSSPASGAGLTDASTHALAPGILETITVLFWEKGYDTVSMEEIVQASGLSRYTIYARWGSKRGLFLDVLEQYKRMFVAELFEPLQDGRAGLPGIRAMFDRMIEYCQREETRRGCLVCTTLVDQARGEDPEFSRRIESFLDGHRELFLNTLRTARDADELAPGVDVEAYADFLVGIMQGAHLFAKRAAPPATFRHFLDTAYSALR